MRVRLLCALALCAGALATSATAQDWPRERTTITVGFGPGSGVDLLVRVWADAMAARHGKTFIVENKPGAAGNISMDQVAKAAPDGSLIGGAIYSPMVTNPMLMTRMPFDPIKDLAPITIIASTPSAMVVSNKLGVTSLEHFMEFVRKEPGKYTFASLGVGSIGHLSMEMAAFLAGSRMVHVPFRSTPEVVQSVLSGEVHAATVALGLIAEHIAARTVTGMALTSAQRWPSLPDLPTTAEAGMPEMPVDAYVALMAPAATPRAIIERIWRDTVEVTAIPAVRERLAQIYFRPVANSPEAFGQVLDSERKVWEPLLKRLGLFKKE